MKINQEMNATKEAAKHQQRQPIEHGQRFRGIVQSQVNQLQHQEIEKLVDDITKQGNKLARFRSFRDLAKFKHMVKRFLKEATANGLKRDSDHRVGPLGHTRRFATIKEVDEKLIELTEAMMNEEKKTVDLLALIGEIKGLLLNIYV